MNKNHKASINKISVEKPNLYLIGFMGTGKSKVGSLLAPQLELCFLDSDQAIETQTGLTVKAIFEKKGEAYFRNLERKFIEEGHPAQGCLLACGGGLPIPSGMLGLLESKGIVVCLFVSPDTIFRRTTKSKDIRPLLEKEDKKATINRLLQQRLPIYQKTSLCISTEGLTPAEIATRITHIYHQKTNSVIK